MVTANATGRRWPCVLDTNILIRSLTQRPEEQREREEVHRAIAGMARRGQPMYTLPLILMEFYRVATRRENGLGLSEAQAVAEMKRIEIIAPCLDDATEVLTEWRELLATEQVPSAQVYDAYIAASLRVHPRLQGQSDDRGTLYPRLLTFNGEDFRRYAGRALFRVVPPRDIAGPPLSSDTATL